MRTGDKRLVDGVFMEGGSVVGDRFCFATAVASKSAAAKVSLMVYGPDGYGQDIRHACTTGRLGRRVCVCIRV